MTSALLRRTLLGRTLLAAPALILARPAIAQEDVRAAAARLEPLRGLIVARQGEILLEQRIAGPALDRPVNVKSVSKAIIAALAGAAIARGLLEGPDQRIAPLLADRLPRDADPRLQRITLDHLLSMRSGLERTSGVNYGRWVASPDWVRHALARPFVAEPGGPMLYSTGNSHLVSAILTRVARRSTHALAEEWLGRPLGIAIPPWPRDPQGIFFGGNDMLLSPRSMLVFGEMIRAGGLHEGRRVLPEGWVATCFAPRTASVFTGAAHGYAWFTATGPGPVRHYAWGFGGQMIHVVPSLGATVVMTSDPTQRSGGAQGHARALHGLMEGTILPLLAQG
ncbi:serine hydrolase domain-containing protein [Roseococcus suduntuyensis]|uniref:CubicO group peptidase (Beta-lactamase class C family) n=1 Tax=Roseococcus suduntuyensis TaxID=455361 RepID=A0A840A821_9PROT|nr:serine hydrolase [Roseococcus suduntuyensis]MBB3898208.1 CubicO group peptidase (beta-lactamase class C family) [Roseococcus suduntuyensis]